MAAIEATDLKQRFANLSMQPVTRQLGLLVGLAASIALGISLVQWSMTPDYSPLYGEMSPAATTEVIQSLEASGIKYKFNNRNGVISVPADQVFQARLSLASEGLPEKNGSGFNMLYKEQEIGVSSFIEKARYDRALEQELSRSIALLDSVRSARVHLALPKQSSFVRKKNKPAASVLLSLYGGRTLSETQLAGVVHLVASSVPGLNAENVSVVDSQGKLLSGQKDKDGLAHSKEQISYTRQLEQDYRERITDILTPILGFGAVRAQVSAEVDFTQVEKTSESFSPDSSIRSEQLVEELTNSSRVGGVPGTLSNQPPAETEVTDSDDEDTVNSVADRTSTRQIRNYELDKTISHVREAPASLKKLSVAVVLDYQEQLNDDGELERSPLSAERIAEITSLVKEAVGFDEARGDSVNVLNASFVPVEELEPLPEPSMMEQEWVWRIIKYVLGGVAVILLIFSVLRPLMQVSSAPALAGNIALPQGAANQQLGLAQAADGLALGEDQVTIGGQQMAGQQALGQQAQMGLLPGTPAYQQQLSMAQSMAQAEPERVAHVVKNWVSGDE